MPTLHVMLVYFQILFQVLVKLKHPWMLVEQSIEEQSFHDSHNSHFMTAVATQQCTCSLTGALTRRSENSSRFWFHRFQKAEEQFRAEATATAQLTFSQAAHNDTWVLIEFISKGAIFPFRFFSHLFKIVEPVDMAVRSQVDADAAAVQAFGGGTQLQQSLDVLSLQLCCLQHVRQPYLHHIQLAAYHSTTGLKLVSNWSQTGLKLVNWSLVG